MSGAAKAGRHGGCFDCGRLDGTLKSVTVSPAPRETSRGRIPPGAGSVALCDKCFAAEKAAAR